MSGTKALVDGRSVLRSPPRRPLRLVCPGLPPSRYSKPESCAVMWPGCSTRTGANYATLLASRRRVSLYAEALPLFTSGRLELLSDHISGGLAIAAHEGEWSRCLAIAQLDDTGLLEFVERRPDLLALGAAHHRQKHGDQARGSHTSGPSCILGAQAIGLWSYVRRGHTASATGWDGSRPVTTRNARRADPGGRSR